MTVIMGATRPSGSGSFGNAILTRLPVIASTSHDLSHGRYERRGCLRVDLAADGAIIHFFNCHFGRRFKERREQLGLLAALLTVTDVQGPRVLVGDFNEWHRGPITRGLRREFPRLGLGCAAPIPRPFRSLRSTASTGTRIWKAQGSARTGAGSHGSRPTTCPSWRRSACGRSATRSTRRQREQLHRLTRA
jgi:hypothetical protein